MSRRPTGRPTVWQVAERAGVSAQTVSRYLRRDGGFRTRTAESIEAAITELGYRPNLVARSMRTRLTGVLALVMPPRIQAVPTRSVMAAADVAHQAGFALEITLTEGAPEDRARVVEDLVDSGRVEGVLSFGSISGLASHGPTATSCALHIFDHFDADFRGQGPLADSTLVGGIIEHLAELGHRRFIHLAGPQEWTTAASRRRAYDEAIAALGLTSRGVKECGWSVTSGHQAMTSLLDLDATAVVSASDHIAIGAIRAAWEAGLSTPEDLSVTGWDDLDVSHALVPSLTTVAVDREAQGRFAMQALLSRVTGRPCPEELQEINELIIRESTGPAPS
ncbi:LacI family DNA-binding transcriptional regulator [Nesterenkonia sp. HG001]|uniref:LacI family DNA-binding transcriptional regulator n=1 Tax=Nesterenkonia sp. HG001 TaxID=2983207 RepID=UPI002AC42A76|nr:LacI family DNA-binding transcriptional regulator [Nesterenkonia sp. HG001]MDZ5077229.1 LacI family transcriptional regulator [Nesterenkonia sp. HG001]